MTHREAQVTGLRHHMKIVLGYLATLQGVEGTTGADYGAYAVMYEDMHRLCERVQRNEDKRHVSNTPQP